MGGISCDYFIFVYTHPIDSLNHFVLDLMSPTNTINISGTSIKWVAMNRIFEVIGCGMNGF